MSYRTQASRPDYSEKEVKEPRRSAKEFWLEFRESRKKSIKSLSGWRRALSTIAHGAGVIFIVLLLPILLFSVIVSFIGALGLMKVFMIIAILAVVIFLCFLACILAFEPF